jgi:hypothetical protein
MLHMNLYKTKSKIYFIGKGECNMDIMETYFEELEKERKISIMHHQKEIIESYKNINSDKITFKRKPRATGKTTAIQQILREHDDIAVIVHASPLQEAYLPEFKGRVFTIHNFINESRGRKIKKVVIDEGFSSSESMLQLYYQLGKYGIEVLVVGT